MNWQGTWIWASDQTPRRNAFVRFRRCFQYDGGPAALDITADSRYVLYINGMYMAQGPVREWPSHWRYDSYDIEPHLRSGENVVSVLVNWFGEGNYQYISAPPGLLAQIELPGGIIFTDRNWLASPDPSFASVCPRIGAQMAFEEQFDARGYDGWREPGHDDSSWAPAVELRPALDGFHGDLEPREIPFLTMESVLPSKLVAVEAVRSIPHHHTVFVKPYFFPPGSPDYPVTLAHAYLATRIESQADTDVSISEYRLRAPIKVNGQLVEDSKAHLRRGWNDVVLSLRSLYQLPEVAICIDGPPELRLCSTGNAGGSPWAVVGPFGLGKEDDKRLFDYVDDTPTASKPLTPEATLEHGESLWESGDVAAVQGAAYFQQVLPEHVPPVNVLARACTDYEVDRQVSVENPEALISGVGWATIHPVDGADVRVLLDFGTEITGYHSFELLTEAGAVLDMLSFECIRWDGTRQLPENVNVTCRYICRDGYQAYQTYARRGFRYTYLIFRNMSGPVRVRAVAAIFSTYPQARRGGFASSDYGLNALWQAGAHTIRCCSEDTYTDCPCWEQAHWVGDGRNEALVDWVVNGDNRLWYRLLQQAGRSLERSTIVESHVPGCWPSVLTAWTFLWMRSCREYLLYTGDIDGSASLMEFVERNVEGMRGFINEKGLFDIRAWNLLDWAPIDNPSRGVVTHNNCLAVQGLKEAGEMARWLGRREQAEQWEELAVSMGSAVNRYLWSNEKSAYVDCLHGTDQSNSTSEQAQTLAYLSGVAAGERAERCVEFVRNPPDGVVRVGSPFISFLTLEAFEKAGQSDAVFNLLRRWLRMLDDGGTTCWENWPGEGGYPRSYCHGWSAAPTFWLSTYVLGVRPRAPGFSRTTVEPHPGDLTWCRGCVPTPQGDIEVRWRNEPGQPFNLEVTCPESLEVGVVLPRAGSAVVNGNTV